MRFRVIDLNFIILYFVALYVICSGKTPFAGPFEMVFKRFYKCENATDEYFTYNTKFYKINRTHNAYRTNMTSPGLLDTMHATIDFSIYGNGGWQDNFFHFRLNKACSDLRKLFPNMLISIFKAAGKTFRGCPSTETFLEIKNWIYPFKPAVPIFPYGRYKSVSRVYEKEKLLTCFIFEMDAIPEVKPTPRMTRNPRKH